MRWYPTHKEVVKIKEIISGLPLARDLTYTESNHAQLHSLSESRPHSHKREALSQEEEALAVSAHPPLAPLAPAPQRSFGNGPLSAALGPTPLAGS